LVVIFERFYFDGDLGLSHKLTQNVYFLSPIMLSNLEIIFQIN